MRRAGPCLDDDIAALHVQAASSSSSCMTGAAGTVSDCDTGAKASAPTAVQVRQRLINTRRRMEDLLAGNQPSDSDEFFESTDDLAAPLLSCYWSLWDCGACKPAALAGLHFVSS